MVASLMSSAGVRARSLPLVTRETFHATPRSVCAFLYGPPHPTRRLAPPEILAQIDDDVGHAASRRQKFLGKSMMMSPLLPVPRICSTASSLPPSSAIFSSRCASNAATQSAMPSMSSSLVNGAASGSNRHETSDLHASTTTNGRNASESPRNMARQTLERDAGACCAGRRPYLGSGLLGSPENRYNLPHFRVHRGNPG